MDPKNLCNNVRSFLKWCMFVIPPLRGQLEVDFQSSLGSQPSRISVPNSVRDPVSQIRQRDTEEDNWMLTSGLLTYTHLTPPHEHTLTKACTSNTWTNKNLNQCIHFPREKSCMYMNVKYCEVLQGPGLLGVCGSKAFPTQFLSQLGFLLL